LKWDDLDVDKSGELSGDELIKIAEWVWSSFNPDGNINKDAIEKEAVKILKRCDTSGDGVIDQEEFEVYFKKTSASILKFQEIMISKKKKEKKEPVPETVLTPQDEKKLKFLSIRAQTKWEELDHDGSGYLEGDEILRS